MKIARFFAVILGCVGVVALLGSMAFFLLSRNAPVRISQMPQEAVNTSERFARCLNVGDLPGAAQLIYGQPDLGVEGMPEDPDAAHIWHVFVSSISFEYTGKCQPVDSGLTRTASVTTLDIDAVMEGLPERIQSLVNQKIASAESLTDVYDEGGSFREELTEQILRDALDQALDQDTGTITREVSIKLIHRDGKWWIVPDQTLLQAISGLA